MGSQLNNFMQSDEIFPTQGEFQLNLQSKTVSANSQRKSKKQEAKNEIKIMKKMLIDRVIKSQEFQSIKQNDKLRNMILLNLSDMELDNIPSEQFVQMIDEQRNLIKMLQPTISSVEEVKAQPNIFHREQNDEVIQQEEQKQTKHFTGNFENIGLIGESQDPKENHLKLSPIFIGSKSQSKKKSNIQPKKKFSTAVQKPEVDIEIRKSKNILTQRDELSSDRSLQIPFDKRNNNLLQIDLTSVYTPKTNNKFKKSSQIDLSQIMQKSIQIKKEHTLQQLFQKSLDPPIQVKKTIPFDFGGQVKQALSKGIKNEMDKCTKEKMKKLCIDCGGYKAPDKSPRTKAKARALKQKLKQMQMKKKMVQRDNESNKKMGQLISSLPYFLQVILSVCCGIEKDKKGVDDTPISYKVLNKHIAQCHPVDPLTQEKFSIYQSATVNNYGLKLTDACFCMAFYHFLRKTKNRILNWLFKKQKKLIEKPESMKDVPDSGSDSENHDSFQGLSQAAIYVGEGAILYLQIVKTLGIMCVILSIINMPLYVVYSNAANLAPVNIFNITEVIQGYCMGNIGAARHVCQNTHIPADSGTKLYPYLTDIEIHLQGLKTNEPKVLEFRCPFLGGYFYKLSHFGFLHKIDYELDSFSSAQQRCEAVNNFNFDFLEQPQLDLEETYTISEDMRNSGIDLTEYQNALMNPNLIPDTTKHNIDKECNFETMFKSPDAKQEVSLHLEQTCFLKNSCSIDIENMVTNITYTKKEWQQMTNQPFNPKQPWKVRTNKLSDLITEDCYKRMYDLEVTQTNLIAILSCHKDTMKFPLVPTGQIHKEELGFIAVICDIISICVMYYMFGKLKIMNEEYLTILDNNVIRMKDFSIQLRRLQFDNSTQDIRILKLKLWLHFEDLLSDFKNDTNQMEIADIQFSFSKCERHIFIYKIAALKSTVDEIDRKKANGEYSPSELWIKAKELEKCLERILKYELKYKEAVALEFKNALSVKTAPKWQLYDMVEYVYISFKSNQTPKKVHELFVIEPTSSKILRRIFCIDDSVKDNIELEDQQLKVQPTFDPDQILWNNIGYSLKDQQIRAIISVFVQILVMVFSVLVTLGIANLQSQVDKAPLCPKEDIMPEKAYSKQITFMLIEMVKAEKENPAITVEEIEKLKTKIKLSDTMCCFCKAYTKSGWAIWRIFTSNWMEYDVDGLDQNNYCALWYKKYIYTLFIKNINEFSVIILNSLIAIVLQYLSEFLKRHTTISEQKTGFQQIFSQEYFNLGCIFLLTSFDPSGFSQKVSGQKTPKIYRGFSFNWYQDVGKGLCLALFASALVSNITEIRKLVTSTLRRLKDRGFKPNLKKDLEDEDDDEPNSKFKVQKDLNDLYTGQCFEGAGTFSRIMSTLMVILSYSSGLPVLYIIGAIFFFFTYYVNKIVLYKYYQKSLDLNRVVPQYSMEFLNLCLFLHIIVGGFMITNPTLFATQSDADNFFMPIIPINPGQELKNSAGVTTEENPSTVDSEQQSELSFTVRIVNKLGSRMQYLHQQVYLAFIVGIIASYISGAFLKGTIIFLWGRSIKLCKTCWSIIYRMMIRTYKFIKNMLFSCFGMIQEKVIAPAALQRKKVIRKFSVSQTGLIQSPEDSVSIEPGTPKLENRISSQAQKVIDQMEDDIHDEHDEAEKLRKEKLLLRFKMQIEKPYWSDNIYLELNIENLTQSYIRAIQDIKDIKKFFCITEENESEVFKFSGKSRKKSEIRIQFEEKCYLTKLTFGEVRSYLDILQKRHDDIEEVITQHYNTVKKAIVKEKQDKMYRQMRKDDEQQKKLNQKGDKTITNRTARRSTNRTARKSTNRSKASDNLTKKENGEREKEEAIQKLVIRDQLAADPDLQFDNPFICTPMKKLQQLYEFEETLLTIDKNKKENRRGLQTICRMQGSLSQSYFLWDAQQHKLSREIFYELENREEEDVYDNNEELEDIYSHMQFQQKNDVLRTQKDIDREIVNKQ